MKQILFTMILISLSSASYADHKNRAGQLVKIVCGTPSSSPDSRHILMEDIANGTQNYRFGKTAEEDLNDQLSFLDNIEVVSQPTISKSKTCVTVYFNQDAP